MVIAVGSKQWKKSKCVKPEVVDGKETGVFATLPLDCKLMIFDQLDTASLQTCFKVLNTMNLSFVDLQALETIHCLQ